MLVGHIPVMMHVRMFEGTKGVSTGSGYAVVKQFRCGASLSSSANKETFAQYCVRLPPPFRLPPHTATKK